MLAKAGQEMLIALLGTLCVLHSESMVNHEVLPKFPLCLRDWPSVVRFPSNTSTVLQQRYITTRFLLRNVREQQLTGQGYLHLAQSSHSHTSGWEGDRSF
jgi:hypothetical protein